MHKLYYLTFFDLINNSATLKKDGSLITELDLHLDLEIRNLYNEYNPINPIIISEESYQGDKNETYNLKNRDFLIVDPIDGTENFNFFSFMYGVAISGRIKGIDSVSNVWGISAYFNTPNRLQCHSFSTLSR